MDIEKENMAKELKALQRTLSSFGYGSRDATEEETKSNTLLNSGTHVECLRETSDLKREIKQKEDIIQTLMNPDGNANERLQIENRNLGKELDVWKAKVTILNKKLQETSMQLENRMRDTEDLIRRRVEDTKNENIRLKEELDDLNYNYKQVVRQVIELEGTKKN